MVKQSFHFCYKSFLHSVEVVHFIKSFNLAFIQLWKNMRIFKAKYKWFQVVVKRISTKLYIIPLTVLTVYSSTVLSVSKLYLQTAMDLGFPLSLLCLNKLVKNIILFVKGKASFITSNAAKRKQGISWQPLVHRGCCGSLAPISRSTHVLLAGSFCSSDDFALNPLQLAEQSIL